MQVDRELVSMSSPEYQSLEHALMAGAVIGCPNQLAADKVKPWHRLLAFSALQGDPT